MDISNPKLTGINIPMQAQKDYTVQATFTGEGKGKLTSAGTIMFLGSDPSNFFEITSFKDGKMSGWFFMNGLRGSFSGKGKGLKK